MSDLLEASYNYIRDDFEKILDESWANAFVILKDFINIDLPESVKNRRNVYTSIFFSLLILLLSKLLYKYYLLVVS